MSINDKWINQTWYLRMLEHKSATRKEWRADMCYVMDEAEKSSEWQEASQKRAHMYGFIYVK